jgi:phosphonate transport system substrate-binding protein
MNQKLLFSIIAAMAIIGVATALFSQNAEAQSLVPEWVKNNAAWWAEGSVDDQTFLNGIEFLIENGVINVSSGNQSIDTDTLTIGFIPSSLRKVSRKQTWCRCRSCCSYKL